MFIVKNTVETKRISRVIQYPYVVGFGKSEYTILMKLLSDVPLTEFEEDRADRMQATLSQLSHVARINVDAKSSSNVEICIKETSDI